MSVPLAPLPCQGERHMVEALNDLRMGMVTRRVQAFVASVRRPLQMADSIKPTKLFCTNR